MDHKILPQLIVCAAIRNKKGEIIAGVRHMDSIMRCQIMNSVMPGAWAGAEQGFLDQMGNFLTREEALAVATKENQIRRRCGGDTLRLYSENLY